MQQEASGQSDQRGAGRFAETGTMAGEEAEQGLPLPPTGRAATAPPASTGHLGETAAGSDQVTSDENRESFLKTQEAGESAALPSR